MVILTLTGADLDLVVKSDDREAPWLALSGASRISGSSWTSARAVLLARGGTIRGIIMLGIDAPDQCKLPLT
jgi:hypothetical protein